MYTEKFSSDTIKSTLDKPGPDTYNQELDEKLDDNSEELTTLCCFRAAKRGQGCSKSATRKPSLQWFEKVSEVKITSTRHTTYSGRITGIVY